MGNADFGDGVDACAHCLSDQFLGEAVDDDYYHRFHIEEKIGLHRGLQGGAIIVAAAPQ